MTTPWRTAFIALAANEQFKVVQLEKEQHLAIARGGLTHDFVPVLRVPVHEVEQLGCKHFALQVSVGEFRLATAFRPSE